MTLTLLVCVTEVRGKLFKAHSKQKHSFSSPFSSRKSSPLLRIRRQEICIVSFWQPHRWNLSLGDAYVLHACILESEHLVKDEAWWRGWAEGEKKGKNRDEKGKIWCRDGGFKRAWKDGKEWKERSGKTLCFPLVHLGVHPLCNGDK